MKNKRKEFFKYVIPSICSMLVSALYVVVDGIFVGQGVGEQALAAVNIAVPFITLLTATSIMLTVGGATITSINLGKKDKNSANISFMTTVNIIFIFSAILCIMGTFFSNIIARFSGANEMLLNDTSIYIRYYSLFVIFLCLAIALSVFVRNDGAPTLASIGMISGALFNIFLDWLFVFHFKLGIKGAAIASGLGQILSLLLLSSHFIMKKGDLKLSKTKLQINLIIKIIKLGLPEFITQISPSVTILCYNLVVIKYWGEIGVAAFSIICYVLTLIVGVFVGVSQGVQPLISRSYGEGNHGNIHYFVKLGIATNLTLSAIIYLILLVGGKTIISLFNSNTELIDLAYNAIKIYGLSFIIASINIVSITYLLSTKNVKNAMIISMSRGLIFNSLFIFIIPLLLGQSFIWVTIVIVEFLSLMISIKFLVNSKDIGFVKLT